MEERGTASARAGKLGAWRFDDRYTFWAPKFDVSHPMSDASSRNVNSIHRISVLAISLATELPRV